MTKKLLIISSENISSWISKGENAPRYFNPGNFFEEVHILLINNDHPDLSLVQPLVGEAKLFIYNHPEPDNFFKKTLGWQPILMKKWANLAVEMVIKIHPTLVRCYGLHINALLALQIKQKLKIPFITSLHGNPDIDYLRGRLGLTLKDKIIGKCQEQLEMHCLKYVDHVIAVYSPIEPYLQKHRVKSYSIIHNVVGHGAEIKQNYNIDPNYINLICVGRQTILQKDPTNIIKAISQIPNTYLTLVGDGDLHNGLIELSITLGCKNRIKFIKSIENKKLFTLMKNSDFYIYNSINFEISKSCIEAALIGLPVILNNRFGKPAQELVDAGFYLVEDSPAAYKECIEKLVNDQEYRVNLAKNSHQYSLKNWAPNITEQKIVDLYSRFVSHKSNNLLNN